MRGMIKTKVITPKPGSVNFSATNVSISFSEMDVAFWDAFAVKEASIVGRMENLVS